MEGVIKNFINYLFEFGLVGVKTVKTILSVYESNKNVILYSQSLKNDDKLKIIFSEYLKIITGVLISPSELISGEESSTISNNYSNYFLDYLSEDIIERYKEHDKIEKLRKLKNLYKFYKFGSDMKLMKGFFKFKNNTLMIKRSFSKTKQVSCSRNNARRFNKSDKSDLVTNSSTSAIKIFSSTSTNQLFLTKKEEDDLIHCTFRPNMNITKTRNNSKNKEEIFTRLYDEFKILKEKKELIKEKKERENTEKFKFMYISNALKGAGCNFTNDQDFLQRQVNFQEIQKEKHYNKIKEDDERFDSMYPFKPRTNSCGSLRNNGEDCKVSPIDRFNKLYEQGRNKNKNRSLDADIHSHYQTARHSPKRNLNLDKINNLYNDYKNKNGRIKEILKNVEIEQGITFKPNLVSSNKYKINSTFHQRNISAIKIDSVNPIEKNEKKGNTSTSKISKSTNLSRNSSCKNIIVPKNPLKKRIIDFNTYSINNSIRINNHHNQSQNTIVALNSSNKLNSIAESTISHKDLIYFTLNPDGSLRNSNKKLANSQEKENNLNQQNESTSKFNLKDKQTGVKFRSSTLKNLIDTKYI